jgi:hypothetical protein
MVSETGFHEGHQTLAGCSGRFSCIKSPVSPITTGSIRYLFNSKWQQPFETPADARLEGGEFGQRRPRHHGQRDVALPDVGNGAIEVVCQKRAAGSAFLPARR